MNFFTALGIAFIVLKLLGFISWSWWLVLLPIIWPLAIFLIPIMIMAFAGLIVFIGGIFALIGAAKVKR